MIEAVLILSGILLRSISYRHLQGNYSTLLLPRERIITTGIYKYIRHPGYTGSLLMILGTSMLHPVAGIMMLAYVMFMMRATQEEYILMTNNADYQKYFKTAGRFLPKIGGNDG